MALANCRLSVLSRYLGRCGCRCLMLNFFRHKTETTPIIKSASIIGLATILLGMLCLVLDLTNPLYFWRILVYYNPTSVMSIGVMLLLFYIPLVAVLMVTSFADTFSKLAAVRLG